MKKFTLLLAGTLYLQFAYSQITSAVDWHGQLRIDGAYIYNQHDEKVQLTGPSLFWSNTYWGGDKFYTQQVVETIVDDWEAPIIRVAMGVDETGGYISDKSNLTRAKKVIDYAIAYGIYVIVDWHSHHAENYKAQAITFFKEIAKEYGHHPNIIYEIYNEPLDVSWSGVVKPYAEAVINEIRKIDPDNIIVVGTPTWSQDVHEAAANPIKGYSNIAYTMHFYAGTHGQWLRDRTKQAMNSGICIIVTEWGMVNANGDGAVATEETNLWIEFMEENYLTNCIWALNDKSEGASMLKPGASGNGWWNQNQLTECGKIAYDLIKNSEGNWVSIDDVKSEELNFYINGNGEFEVNEDVLGLSLYDVNGRLLERHDSKIQVRNLRPGFYVIQIKTNDKVYNHKFVK